MKTIAIKVRGYAGSVSIVNNSDIQKRIFSIMLLSLGSLAVCYVLILGSMVFNIVGRKTAEASARTLSNEVGALELQYLSMSNKIDLAYAHSLGYKETRVKYATRRSVGSIRLPKNEI